MKRTHSIKYWFILFSIVWGLLGGIIAVTVGICTLRNLQEDAAEERRELLSFYLEQIDADLRNAYYSLIEVSQNNEDVVQLQLKTNPSDNALHKNALSKAVQSLAYTRAEVTGYFLYTAEDGLGHEFFTFATSGNQTQVSSLPRLVFLDFIRETVAAPDLSLDRWSVVELNNQQYLLCVVYAHNTYTGCYVNIDSLIMPLDRIGIKHGDSFFTDSSGLALTDSPLESNQVALVAEGKSYRTETIAGETYIVIGAKSSVTQIYLVALIANQTIFSSFAPYFTTLMIILLSSVLQIPLIQMILWSVLDRSLSGLLSVIEEVKAGNTAIRADISTRISEMMILNQSFNEMMDETNALKISIYEQQLKDRQTYLDYLQLQIRPHFFLNSLNLVYSLAELKRYDQIKQLSLELVQYFRYMFHHSSTTVTVKEELDHAQNYIHIHRLRFPDGIDYTVEAEEGLMDALLPPISIQTFVENSVKYAYDPNKQTAIRIKIARRGENLEKLQVSVHDNGKGFSSDMLVALNSDKRLSEDEIHRIGITNVKERITMLFGDAAETRFYNNRGSVSEFTIPLTFRES